MKMTYYPKGTCSRQMDIEIDGGVIKDVKIHYGCDGNLKGIARLVKGRPVEEVADLLRGIKCGAKSTSCPDQLAKALDQYMRENG